MLLSFSEERYLVYCFLSDFEPEEVMRTTINDDVEMYWGKINDSKCCSTNKNGKSHMYLKKDILMEDVGICLFEYNIPPNFYQSSNAWKVEHNFCNGKNCSIDFGIQKNCHNNVWICAGQKYHKFNIVYCNNCFFYEKNIVQGTHS